MMRRHLTSAHTCTRPVVAAMLVGLVAGLTLVSCQDDAVSNLTVRGAWARTTPPGASSGVAYLRVISPVDDELTGVSVPPTVAGAAAMHETMSATDTGGGAMAGMDHSDSNDGAMVMVPLDMVALPAGRWVLFEPGGRHVMLTDLVAPLGAGEHVILTLRFAHHEPIAVDVEVADNAPSS